MKQYIHILWENVRVCYFFFFKKKIREKKCINKRTKITDGLPEATGIYQKWLSNIHTEFLANDGKFLPLVSVTPLLVLK